MFLYENWKAFPLNYRNICITNRTSAQHYLRHSWLWGHNALVSHCCCNRVSQMLCFKHHKFYSCSCGGQKSRMSLAERQSGCHLTACLLKAPENRFHLPSPPPRGCCIPGLTAPFFVFKAHHSSLCRQHPSSFLWFSHLLFSNKDPMVTFGPFR